MDRFISFDEIKRMFPVDPLDYRKFSDRISDVTGGVKLAELRLAKKMTQVQMAKKLKIDQSNVSRIERGSFSKVEIRTLRRYVEAMGGELEIRIRIKDSSKKLVDSEYERELIKKFDRQLRSSPRRKKSSAKPSRRVSVAKPRKKTTITAKKVRTYKASRAKAPTRTPRPS